MRIIILSILILISLSVFSQNVEFTKENFPDKKKELKEAKKHIKAGDNLMEEGKHLYHDAYLLYKKAYDFNPDNALLCYKMGKCALFSLFKSKSIFYLEKAYSLDKHVATDLYFLMGRSYHVNYRFEDATKYYKLYSEQLSKKEKEKLGPAIDKYIAEAELAGNMVNDSLRIFITNLGGAINSPFADYGPVVNADESALYFTSRRSTTLGGERASDGGYYEDILYVEKIGTSFEKVLNPGEPVNTENHDAVVGLSNDGQILFVYKGEEGGDVYYCKLKGQEWSSPKSLSKRINSSAKESSATFSPDMNTIYFVSNRDGGQGGKDIWMSVKNEKGKWQKAVNLGGVVNTPYDEESVFMHPDGKTLYFSSKGHPGMGGYDIFKTVYENGSWSTPVNVGYPINSPGDDLYFTMTAKGRIAYYASVRNGGFGDKDIYKITFLGPEKPVIVSTLDHLLAIEELTIDEQIVEPAIEIKTTQLTLLKGFVLDEESKEPLYARIEVTDNETGVLMAVFESNSKSGKYLLSLPAGKNYGIAVVANDYLFYSENIDIDKSSAFREVNLDIMMKKVEVGKSIILNNIFFAYNEATLEDESKAELDRVVELMKDMPSLKLEIGGHTDSIGSDSYNNNLSKQRAKAVVDYLVAAGIQASRLKYKGYGSKQPIEDNSTEEGRARNRRTEFTVLEK